MGWVHLDVVDVAGRRTVLEVKVKLDVVEWWLGRRCLAMVDRDALADWVRGRLGPELVRDDLSLVHTRIGPVVEVRGALPPAPLSPVTFLDLRDQLLQGQHL